MKRLSQIGSVIQESSQSVYYWRLLAQILGMIVGCIIGLFPLLFMKQKTRFADRLALSLPADQKAILHRSLVPGSFEFGDVIIRKGDTVQWVYFIEEGHAEIIGYTVEGQVMHVDTVGPGDVVGELEVMASRRSATDVVAVESLVVQRLHATDFLRLFGSRLEIMKERQSSPIYQYYAGAPPKVDTEGIMSA